MGAGLTFRRVLRRDIDQLDRLHEHLPEEVGRSFWHYQSCPDEDGDFPCLFYLLDEADRLVSSIYSIPDWITIHGRTRRWAWTANLFTAPEARGRGLATRLQRESMSYLHGLGIGRGSVFSTEATLHIYRKLGFVLPGHARRFLMLKSVRPLLEAHIRNPALRGVLSALSQPLMKSASRACAGLSRMRGVGAECVEVPNCSDGRMAEALDHLEQGDVQFCTDAERLQWKIDVANRREGSRCVPYVLRSVPLGEPLGYAVILTKRQDQPLAGVYKNFELMRLMDFALTRRSRGVYQAMLREILALFFGSGAEVLEIISNDDGMDDVARKGGLVRVGKGMSFAFSVPEEWGIGPKTNELPRWPLTHFSGDGFFL